MILLLVYSLISAAGIYLDYLAGLYVETLYGGQVSLVFFLGVFFTILVLAFPLALRLSPSERA